MGVFIYAIFGSCKDITIGPTAIMSLMTLEHSTAGGDDPVASARYAILLCFLSGVIELICGILHLGRYANLKLRVAIRWIPEIFKVAVQFFFIAVRLRLFNVSDGR